MTERRAYLQAFRAYENCKARKIFPYNLAVAIFIARNRSTTWANGAALNTRPEEGGGKEGRREGGREGGGREEGKREEGRREEGGREEGGDIIQVVSEVDKVGVHSSVADSLSIVNKVPVGCQIKVLDAVECCDLRDPLWHGNDISLQTTDPIRIPDDGLLLVVKAKLGQYLRPWCSTNHFSLGNDCACIGGLFVIMSRSRSAERNQFLKMWTRSC